MDKDLLKLLPNEQELALLSGKLKATITSREELLTRIGTLKLEEMSLEEKMVYVIGLISLGFEEVRARKRLGIKNSEFYIWKQQDNHEAMLDSAIARGEMVLEEKVLVEAEKNPRMAFELLKERSRSQERKEDRDFEKRKSIWDIMNENAKERGLIQEGEIVEEILK